jgi:hypothetical protein
MPPQTSRLRAWWTEMRDVVRTMGIASVAGFVVGTILLGTLLRLAMFVLRLTSDSSLRGVETDFGATIGRFSAVDTGLFMLGCGGAGVIAGIVYLAIRPVVPPRGRAPVAALAAGTFGPAVIIDPEGVDFAILEPALLAVAMFVASLAVFGYAVSVAVEWLLRVPWWRTSGAAWIVMAPLLLVTLVAAFPFGIPAVVIAAAVSAWRTTPSSTAAAPRTGLARAGQIGVVAAIGLSTVFLLVDVAALS